MKNLLMISVVAATIFPVASIAQAQNETVVEVTSVSEVATYLKKIGFYDIDKHPERLQSVPRTRIFRIPKKLTKAWIENIPLRKSVFFRLGISGILQANEEILVHRKRLQSFSLNNINEQDQSWFSKMMLRYNVGNAEDQVTANRLAELLLRVDALPPSLVMAQGAIESGWFQSRFARQGQAVFGQWTSSSNGIKALNSSVRLAAFETPRQSLIAYMLNLNTHPAYKKLRHSRAKMRRSGQPLDGFSLAAHLGKYAETGDVYIRLIRNVIRRNKLARGDTAKLSLGPRIVFRRIDRK